MKRKDFIKKSLAGFTAATVLSNVKVKAEHSTYNKMMEQVGFNHLPNKEIKDMNTVLHKANTRGHANHGWLDAHHSFSFANYYNPERMHFGVLRVLNDDRIAGGRGFGMHPHDNMEIITIPLQGNLQHKDNMGNAAVIKQGDVQVMSAGTGIMHSEFNEQADKEVKLLQIWMFPNKKNVTPRYDQITLKNQEVRNQFYQVLSPNADDEGVWVHQNAWFHLGKFDEDTNANYELKAPTTNGVYAFVINGSVTIEGQELGLRDGFGVWNTDCLDIKASKDAHILLMEVPMKLG